MFLLEPPLRPLAVTVDEMSIGGKDGSKSLHLVIVVIVLQMTAIAFLCLRIVSRVWVSQGMRSDDVFSIIGSVLNIGVTTALCVAAYAGCGRHIEDLTYRNFQIAMRSIWINSLFYPWAFMFVKVSILVFYRRFAVFSFMRNFLAIMMVLVVLQSSEWFLCNMFQCTTLSIMWKVELESSKCFNITAIYDANSALSISSDFVVLCAPIPILWAAGLSRKQKIGLTGVFSLGIVACAAGIARIVYLPQNSKIDSTWVLADCEMWQSVEIDLAIICSCIPLLKPLLGRLFPCLAGAGGERHDTTPVTRHTHNGIGTLDITVPSRSHRTIIPLSGVQLENEANAREREKSPRPNKPSPPLTGAEENTGLPTVPPRRVLQSGLMGPVSNNQKHSKKAEPATV